MVGSSFPLVTKCEPVEDAYSGFAYSILPITVLFKLVEAYNCFYEAVFGVVKKKISPYHYRCHSEHR